MPDELDEFDFDEAQLEALIEAEYENDSWDD